MSVDVIIPVYRPDEKLNRLLAGLENQTVKPERIIVMHTGEVLEGEPDYRADVVIRCDGTVRDGAEKMEKEDPSVGNGETDPTEISAKIQDNGDRTRRILCIIPGEKFDHGGTRNLGAALSKADVMVFMTHDAVPADEYLLENLVSALEMDSVPEIENEDAREIGAEEKTGADGKDDNDKKAHTGVKKIRVAAAYARQLPYEDCKAVERYIREFNYPAKSELRTSEDIPVRGIKTFCNSNVCAAYPRDLFDQLGGFVEKTIFNEDMLFGAKAVNAGYGVVYSGDAKVYHSHNLGLSDQFHRNFDNAVSQAEHPEIFAAVSSEKEGMKLVKYCISRMKEDGKLYLVPYFVMNCAFRYAGFFLGKRYKRLPMWLVRACSLNKRYWNGRRDI